MSATPFDHDSVLGPPERREIARRTREALAAAKRRGKRLGRPPLYPDELRHRIGTMRAAGMTYAAIADQLDAEGVPTARPGSRWVASTVWRVVESLRLDAEAAAARKKHFDDGGGLFPR